MEQAFDVRASRPSHNRPRALSDEERAYYRLSRLAWSVFAPIYDVIALPLRGLRDVVIEEVSPAREARVLDVATGTGSQAAAFARSCREVVGIDLSPAMIHVARRKHRSANLRFLEADATALPFEDASFDVSCVSFALHEMPSSIRDDALSEMARVTRPEGKIVIADYRLPDGPALRWLVFHVVKLYEPAAYVDFVRSDLDAMLARAGLARCVDARGSRLFSQVIVARKCARQVRP